MRLFSQLYFGLAVIFFASLLSPLSSNASDLVYIRAGHLIDVRSGKLHRDQVISIRGDRIEGVADADDVDIDSNSTVIILVIHMSCRVLLIFMIT